LGLGSLVYNLGCPALIKEHSSDREFIRSESSLITIKRAKLIIRNLKGVAGEDDCCELDKLELGIKEVEDTHGGVISPHSREKYLIDLMAMNWKYECNARLVARVSCSILYLIGFVMLSIPTVSTFVSVSESFFK